MIFRNFAVKCCDCAKFEPNPDNPKTGVCQNIDIDDAEEKRDCRWFEPKEDHDDKE